MKVREAARHAAHAAEDAAAEAVQTTRGALQRAEQAGQVSRLS